MVLRSLVIHRRMNLDTSFSHCTKIKSKWISNPDIKNHGQIKEISMSIQLKKLFKTENNFTTVLQLDIQ